jgi:hypothetical protein
LLLAKAYGFEFILLFSQMAWNWIWEWSTLWVPATGAINYYPDLNLWQFLVLTATNDEMTQIRLATNVTDQPLPITNFNDFSVLFTLGLRYAADADPTFFDDEIMLKNRALLSPELQMVINQAKLASLHGDLNFQVLNILFPSTPAVAL